MTSTTRRLDGPALLAAIGLIFADGAVAEAHPAASASAAPPPASAPPTGHHAPPPPGAERRGAVYDDQAQWYDRDYAQRYAEWAAQNCIDQRTNALAGAAIGGVMGAILGSNLSERRDPAAGAIIGGALGSCGWRRGRIRWRVAMPSGVHRAAGGAGIRPCLARNARLSA